MLIAHRREAAAVPVVCACAVPLPYPAEAREVVCLARNAWRIALLRLTIPVNLDNNDVTHDGESDTSMNGRDLSSRIGPCCAATKGANGEGGVPIGDVRSVVEITPRDLDDACVSDDATVREIHIHSSNVSVRTVGIFGSKLLSRSP